MTDRIIWADVESTNLSPKSGALLEVAVLVTEADLTLVDEGISVVIHADEEQLASLDDYVRKMHSGNGLLDEVRCSELTVADAEQLVLGYVAGHVPKFERASKIGAPLAGNNIKFDRGWFEVWMPEFAAWPHYRDICVSTIQETTRRFFPKVRFSTPPKNYAHRAMGDVHESIVEYHSYLSGLGAELPPLAADRNTGRLLSPSEGLQRISFAKN